MLWCRKNNLPFQLKIDTALDSCNKMLNNENLKIAVEGPNYNENCILNSGVEKFSLFDEDDNCHTGSLQDGFRATIVVYMLKRHSY